MNKVQHLVLVLEVVLQNKQRKLQAGKRGWPKFKWPEFEKLPYSCQPFHCLLTFEGGAFYEITVVGPRIITCSAMANERED